MPNLTNRTLEDKVKRPFRERCRQQNAAFDDYRASHRPVVDAVRRLVHDGQLAAPTVAGGRLAVCQRAQRDLGE
ncbi:hypothetical protein [Mycobacterium botniense]|uniref:Uncharacterized protein n=1 Tax=Mycobacterium botniense TaxID=84962 RepID=A0A7I9XXU3_9MYCO|nr:hypothetical protein [Mycobacterium botniense]GFG74621.1 hypothetical protein MBOT_19860 [Mycobacterium botniense]